MIAPMLAETAREPFDGQDWLFEAKLDGVRCIAHLGDGTKLQARSGADITRKFPEFATLHTQAARPCVLDGEIACATFEAIQHRIHKERPLDIRLAARLNPATFHAFDMLYQNGESRMALPLVERKLALAQTLHNGERAMTLGWQTRYGVALFQRAAEVGLEGIMAKRLASTYQTGRRSPDWLKVKAFREDRFVVCGLTEGENERAKTFGSLVLGKETETGLAYVGNVGSGFTEAMLASLLPVLEGLRAECPFPETPKLDRELKCWVRPFLWCEVRYLEYGSDGKLRLPTFRKLVSGC